MDLRESIRLDALIAHLLFVAGKFPGAQQPPVVIRSNGKLLPFIGTFEVADGVLILGETPPHLTRGNDPTVDDRNQDWE